MDLVLAIALRFVVIIGALWVGVCVAAGTALLWVSWKRRDYQEPVVEQMECPLCNGLGQVVYQYEDDRILNACPLCDGESSLIKELE